MSDHFVDREEEIKVILNHVKMKSNLLIYGLRGIGKTTLLERVRDILVSEGKRVLLIDGYEVLSPEDVFVLMGERPVADSRYAIRALFEMDDHIIMIDEFSSLLQTLARYRPFGKVEEVARYVRSQIQARRGRGGESVILSSPAVGFVRRSTMKYFAPLFREFTLLFIGPMSFEAIFELALRHSLDEERAREVAEIAAGNPFYAKKIIEQVISSGLSPREALFRLINPRGDLDVYFSALMDSLQAEERYILHLVARGSNRFYEIENRLYKDPSPYLRRLEENGLLVKIKKGKKHSEYFICDKVFQAWLLNQEIPSLGKISRKAIYISSLGFEALFREMLRAITTEIELRDALGQKLVIPPFREVFDLRGSGYEIDAVGLLNDEAYVFEVHFWGSAKFDKVEQLIRNAERFARDYGKRVRERVLVSYFGYELREDEIQEVREHGIKLLTAKELRDVQRKTKMYLGF